MSEAACFLRVARTATRKCHALDLAPRRRELPDRRGVSEADELGQKHVFLLTAGDAGEGAVLAFNEHAGVDELAWPFESVP